MEIPKAYKDIYYKIYFNINNNESIIDIQTKSNMYADFEIISDNKYSCTISSMGKSIELLEQIYNKYQM